MRTKLTALGICALVAFVIAGFCAFVDGNEPEAVETQTAQEKESNEGREAGDTMTVDLGGGVEMQFVWIPPGEYMRGSRLSPEETARIYSGGASWYEVEHPRHEVRITWGFWMAKTPVTQEQYERITGENPSHFEGVNRPVESVTWNEAVEYAARLSRQAEGTFRLPTEAEWEYACRAGTETEFYFGDDAHRLGEYAWCFSNQDGGTHPVARKKPNEWGLYDMYGNVWEWCADWLGDYPSGTVTDPTGPDTGERRVLRGGTYSIIAALCRSAYRHSRSPGSRNRYSGFRIVLDFPFEILANDVEAAPITCEPVAMGGGVSMVFANIPDTNAHFTATGQPVRSGFTGEIAKYPTTNAQYAQYLNAALASGDIEVDGNQVKGKNGRLCGRTLLPP